MRKCFPKISVPIQAMQYTQKKRNIEMKRKKRKIKVHELFFGNNSLDERDKANKNYELTMIYEFFISQKAKKQ